MFHDGHILTQLCGDNFMALKVAPLDRFVEAIRAVADLMHPSASFWGEAPTLARRAVNR